MKRWVVFQWKLLLAQRISKPGLTLSVLSKSAFASASPLHVFYLYGSVRSFSPVRWYNLSRRWKVHPIRSATSTEGFFLLCSTPKHYLRVPWKLFKYQRVERTFSIFFFLSPSINPSRITPEDDARSFSFSIRVPSNAFYHKKGKMCGWFFGNFVSP